MTEIYEEYCIVKVYTGAKELEGRVNTLMNGNSTKRFWKPNGQPFKDLDGNFCQAMVRVKISIIKES